MGSMAKLAVTAILLFGIWLVLAGSVTSGTIIAGVVISAVSTIFFREVIAGDSWLGRSERLRQPGQRQTIRRGAQRLLAAVALVPVFLWKVLLSAFNIAFLALKPSIDFWPGIVKVEGGMNTVSGTTLFANLLTLTPGTLTLDYDEKGDALYVHWIDVTGYGEADFDSRVTSGLRAWMRRIGA